MRRANLNYNIILRRDRSLRVRVCDCPLTSTTHDNSTARSHSSEHLSSPIHRIPVSCALHKTRASSSAALGAWATRTRLRPSGTRSRRTVGSGAYMRTQQSTTGGWPPPVSTADDTRRERPRKASGVQSRRGADSVYNIHIYKYRALPVCEYFR